MDFENDIVSYKFFYRTLLLGYFNYLVENYFKRQNKEEDTYVKFKM